MVDVRLPIGALFAIIGALLVIWGLVSSAARGGVNLWWGGVMVAFGALFLWLARRRQ